MKEAPQSISSGDLKLEGVLDLPRVDGERLPGVVLCHPHPLYGGNMNNNVVMAVSRALSEAGLMALRFNFRGAGFSEGTHDNGKGEQDDLRAALEALAEYPEVDQSRLGVMGYSFGGMVALAVAKNCEKMRALAAVSPVVSPGLMNGISKPAYFICGTKDHVVSTELLSKEAQTMNPPGQVEIVPGVDHFWGGHEKEMTAKVAAFFKQAL